MTTATRLKKLIEQGEHVREVKTVDYLMMRCGDCYCHHPENGQCILEMCDDFNEGITCTEKKKYECNNCKKHHEKTQSYPSNKLACERWMRSPYISYYVVVTKPKKGEV